ncbi:MAG: dCTP deaminase [Candidatus Nezhaarchaeales archaeon]
MTILPDRCIRELVEKNNLIDPFDERCLGPASYDARVGSKALKPRAEGSPIVNLEREGILIIDTGEFVEVITLERFNMPNDVAGRIGLRSYYTRKGLQLFSGPQIDPGFKGNLIVSLFNAGPKPIMLRYGDSFCTIEFHKLESPVERPYSGPYQDQKDFPIENVEFIAEAKGVSLAEVIKVVRELRSDVKWMKWLLALILAALLGAIITRLFY